MEIIHPAMFDRSSEFFSTGTGAHELCGGLVVSHTCLPVDYCKLLDSALINNAELSKCLDDWQIMLAEARRHKFYQCNYAAYDHKPDVCEDGSLGKREYVPCSERGNCHHEGRFCKIPFGLTKKERDVLVLIAKGSLDKWIQEELNISENTLRFHKDNIRNKTGAQRKADQVAIAFQYNMV